MLILNDKINILILCSCDKAICSFVLLEEYMERFNEMEMNLMQNQVIVSGRILCGTIFAFHRHLFSY